MKKALTALTMLTIALPVFAADSIPATNITSQCSCTMSNNIITSCQSVPAARMVAFDVYNPNNQLVNGPIAAPIGYSETKNTVDAPVISAYGSDAIAVAPPGTGTYSYVSLFFVSGLHYPTALYVVLTLDIDHKLEILMPINAKWIDPETCQYFGPSTISSKQVKKWSDISTSPKASHYIIPTHDNDPPYGTP